MKRIFAMLLAVLLLLAGCAGGTGTKDAAVTAQPDPTAAATPEGPAMDATGRYLLDEDGEAVVDDATALPAQATDDNYRVFYEIFVGSFSDSDGDGTGDLQGIIDRMDYLNDGDDGDGLSLGVEGLWLSPIFTSASYHKYDVDDYYAIDPAFGTEEDLRQLVELCHERNVKVILDLVINHTGTHNPWFEAFAEAHRSGDTDSPYYDFYCYYTKGETAPAGRTFQKLSGTDIYYECNFSDAMPELNYDNDAVRQAVLDVAAYYMDLGVDGFRFDAAKYIYFGDNGSSAAFWQWYIGQLKAIDPDVYTVAEVWDSDGVTDLYYPALNCFDFTTSQADGLIAQAAQAGSVNRYTAYVQGYLDRVRALNADAMIVPFLSNHDMDRAAGYLTAGGGNMKMAANLYLLSSGSPFLYYGEELGMRGSRGGANTDANRRLKMEWGDGDTVSDPEGSTYDHARVDASAADQMADGDSLYSYYKKLIMIRKANPAICRGEYTALELETPKTGGFTATWEGDTVMVLHNAGTEPAVIQLADLTGLEITGVNAAIGMGGASLDGTTLTLDGQTSAVIGCA